MKTSPALVSLLPLALALVALAGCGRNDTSGADAASAAATPPHPPGSTELHAVAQLQPTRGHDVRGTVRFSSEGDAVRVSGEITGLSPGEHGFHVHENGDCSAADAASAGGHFNPTSHPHAGRDAGQRHAGDFGNITAGADGRATFSFLDPKITLSGANAIVGRAVIVHAGRDDLTSQPSGDSGARVACGVVELERKNF